MHSRVGLPFPPVYCLFHDFTVHFLRKCVLISGASAGSLHEQILHAFRFELVASFYRYHWV